MNFVWMAIVSVLSASFLSPLHAQTTPAMASLRLVNATQDHSKVMIFMNGRDISLGGVDAAFAGAATGYPAGKKEFVAKVGTNSSSALFVDLKPGQVASLAAFYKKIKAPSGERETLHLWDVPFWNFPGPGKSFRIFYLGNEPCSIFCNGKEVTLTPEVAHEILENSLEIRAAPDFSQKIAPLNDGKYTLLLYRDRAQKFQIVGFVDP